MATSVSAKSGRLHVRFLVWPPPKLLPQKSASGTGTLPSAAIKEADQADERHGVPVLLTDEHYHQLLSPLVGNILRLAGLRVTRALNMVTELVKIGRASCRERV